MKMPDITAWPNDPDIPTHIRREDLVKILTVDELSDLENHWKKYKLTFIHGDGVFPHDFLRWQRYYQASHK